MLRRLRDLLVLMFLALLLGAAMIANVSDGPMSEYRGSWVSRITLLIIDQGQRNSAGGTLTQDDAASEALDCRWINSPA